MPVRDPGHVDETALGREARPASATSAGGRADGRVHGTPAPEYGEYAPAGWVNPVLVEQERQAAEEQRRDAAQRQEAAQGRDADARRPSGTVRQASDRRDRATSGPDGRRGSSTSATEPASPYGASRLDFVLTVGLLTLGLWTVLGTLDTGQTASRTRATVEQRFTTMSDPSTMSLAAVLIALSGIVLLALTTWWAVARLRRRKWSTWVPLLGGVVWLTVVVVVLTVVVLADPNLHEWFVGHSRA
ncbi:DUF6264 family protein [Curtobacterium sp. NPDC089185]|uniref:DUF6264 family protein n=1 Tax=Curtobacterium sp. NPDC089185 TaxID=3154968 RepID=UPI00341638FB